ncbi:hypothetical protein B0T24DRAFT_691786 [Lasiosphaeria ovina]|uniref:Transmembrane protein n=1 Tax=Lasiosphaeria ovina TaxID=92902 RepID=A0AAE0JSR7_9PEZI|nr:hypothetical protein B0T24DRAFT_691786 [Lasiosphaeria ovina]
MLAITIAADGTSVASWKVSPTALLAIASAAVTILLNFTLVQRAAGVFDAGLSILFRGPSKMAIALVFVTLAAINSPLLQRALSVETRIISNVVDLDVYAAPRLPRGFTVYVSDDSQELHVPTEVFSTSTLVFTSFVTYTEEESHQHITSIIPSIRDDETPPAEHASLRLFTYDAQWKPAGGCIDATDGATLRKRQCNITPATARYAVVISNGTVSLDPATTYADDVVVANVC